MVLGFFLIKGQSCNDLKLLLGRNVEMVLLVSVQIVSEHGMSLLGLGVSHHHVIQSG